MPELQGPKWDLGLGGLGQAAFDGGDGSEMAGPFVVLPEN
jgi:hypothetical protein